MFPVARDRRRWKDVVMNHVARDRRRWEDVAMNPMVRDRRCWEERETNNYNTTNHILLQMFNQDLQKTTTFAMFLNNFQDD